MPRSDRDSPVVVAAPLLRVAFEAGAEAGERSLCVTGSSLRIGKSHNDVQAFLGIWRT